MIAVLTFIDMYEGNLKEGYLALVGVETSSLTIIILLIDLEVIKIINNLLRADNISL